MSYFTCSDACWGDGPYPDLSDLGDVVQISTPALDSLFISGGMFALLNSYVLTDPAPLERSNVMVPDHPGRFKKRARPIERVVDLEIKVSGLTNSYAYPLISPPIITDPVAQVEDNIDFLISCTVNHPYNLASQCPIILTRKSGAVLTGNVQFDDFGAAPGRRSRLVTIRTTIVAGSLTET